MRAFRCDRCGEFKTGEHAGTILIHNNSRVFSADKTYELCTECLSKLERFTRNQHYKLVYDDEKGVPAHGETDQGEKNKEDERGES